MTKYFISRIDFDRMSMDDSHSLQIYPDYSENGQISNYETETVKKINEHRIEIDNHPYDLLSKNVEVENISHRKPHPAVKRTWDDRAAQIKQFIHEQEVILDKYVREDLKGIRTNLFVGPAYANVVETKINELRKTLAGLTLRVDKLKDHYENVSNQAPEQDTATKTKEAPTSVNTKYVFMSRM